ncbi:hypothetical protein SCOR_23635 [Sulfidibacter corallicola]|uniref:Uncharacterized protein n=1 Tax=Sulfidibacter corallicola TaxID=2818388 RepID=A0A8A4TRK9_SULCO|nr:hypothetical protein [Sulfidibacter corallicola]QTD52596.1 hypothetical protein J3U87_08990 [Sulfidibacter corallicola]
MQDDTDRCCMDSGPVAVTGWLGRLRTSGLSRHLAWLPLAPESLESPAWPEIFVYLVLVMAVTWFVAWLSGRRTREEVQELRAIMVRQSRHLAEKTEELRAVCDVMQMLGEDPKAAPSFALRRFIELIPNLSRGGFLMRGPKDRHFHIVAHTGYDGFHFRRLEFTFEEIISQYADGTEELADGVFLVRYRQLETHDLPAATCMVVLTLELNGLLRGLLVLDHEVDVGILDEMELERLKRMRIYATDIIARIRRR